MGSGTSKINKSGDANTTGENGGGGGRYRCVECKVAPVRLRKRLCEDCIPASDPRELPRRMETFKLSRATSGLARTSTSLSEFFRRGKGTAASATGIADPNLVSMATPALAPESTNHVEQASRTIQKVRTVSVWMLPRVDGQLRWLPLPSTTPLDRPKVRDLSQSRVE
jgi:hypothetical protein